MVRVAHEVVISEPLSDEEHDVLRGLAGALAFPGQDRAVAPRREHGLDTSEHFPMTPPSAPQDRMRVCVTDTASYNPEGKLS